MATLHSTRLRTKTIPRRTSRARIAISAARQMRSHDSYVPNPLKLGTTTRLGAMAPKWIQEFQQVALALRGVYASCVTVQLALYGQNAEQDRDIMRTLRMHVSEPVSRQLDRLDVVVNELKECATDTGGKDVSYIR
jgi:hypothetical protein